MKIIFIFLAMICVTSKIKAQNQNSAVNKNNSNKSIFNSDEEKNQWIIQNPDTYKKAGGQIKSSEEKTKKAETNLENEKPTSVGKIEIPEEPVFIDTGHPKNDQASYNKRMKEWIQKMEAINTFNGVFNQSKKEKDVWIIANPKLYNPNSNH